jgi:NAD(P)-dependent dehydrogenase (short-subunit alcohol dehydrogenase family)
MAGRPRFEGKVAVVTGASGGLGRALCGQLADEGAALGLLDLAGDPLEELQRDLRARGATTWAADCDVTDEAACQRGIDSLVSRLGGMDVLINNAGITQRSPFATTDTAVYRRVMDVNFFGSLHCTRAALPHLIERRGQIGVISSVAGLAPLLGRSGYAASKYALRGFFGSLQAELRADGVGVSMIYPAFIDTGLEHRALGGDGQVTDHPQSRVGQAMTASQAAAAIVGALDRRQRHVVLGRVGHVSRMLSAHWPGLYERIMARALRDELERSSARG